MGGQIECVIRGGEHVEHITEVGGRSLNPQRQRVADVIAAIKRGETYFTEVDGRRADVRYRLNSTTNREYIYTEPDSTKKDNLLALPRCK